MVGPRVGDCEGIWLGLSVGLSQRQSVQYSGSARPFTWYIIVLIIDLLGSRGEGRRGRGRREGGWGCHSNGRRPGRRLQGSTAKRQTKLSWAILVPVRATVGVFSSVLRPIRGLLWGVEPYPTWACAWRPAGQRGGTAFKQLMVSLSLSNISVRPISLHLVAMEKIMLDSL